MLYYTLEWTFVINYNWQNEGQNKSNTQGTIFDYNIVVFNIW